MKEKAQEEALKSAGKLIRCAALALDNPDRVKVIFRGLAGELAFFMSQETYEAIPLMQIATIEDYQERGEVLPAISRDIYQNI
ncbi:MAG: hypothetical protein WC476_11720 [Phycisphaerae bacterium]